MLVLQGTLGSTAYQLSAGQRYSDVGFNPDVVGDLVFSRLLHAAGQRPHAALRPVRQLRERAGQQQQLGVPGRRRRPAVQHHAAADSRSQRLPRQHPGAVRAGRMEDRRRLDRQLRPAR
ncbi:hypothetical protein G6F46_014675 [Rhizopus delemar]|nr:hypothetical protein G6F46_014675 [Rhizopus delemar]